MVYDAGDLQEICLSKPAIKNIWGSHYCKLTAVLLLPAEECKETKCRNHLYMNFNLPIVKYVSSN
jgi:hypothetical protein